MARSWTQVWTQIKSLILSIKYVTFWSAVNRHGGEEMTWR